MKHNKKIFMSIALFVVTMFGASAQDPYALHQLNREIRHTRESIDSVRNANAATLARRLDRNANYRYISEHGDDIDTLRRQNVELMRWAVDLIRKKHPMALISRTRFMFMQYRDVPGISMLGQMYLYNYEKINEYDRRVDAFRPEYMEIKNSCDSAMHAQVDMYQQRLDSLLNRKIELIR